MEFIKPSNLVAHGGCCPTSTGGSTDSQKPDSETSSVPNSITTNSEVSYGAQISDVGGVSMAFVSVLDGELEIASETFEFSGKNNEEMIEGFFVTPDTIFNDQLMFELFALDNSGNSNAVIKTISVTDPYLPQSIDLPPIPELIIQMPEDEVLSGINEINIELSNYESLKKIGFEIDEEPIDLISEEPIFTTIDTSKLSSGTHTLDVIYNDIYEQEYGKSISFSTDNSEMTGMLSDGTKVSISATEPTVNEIMIITVDFVDVSNVNYDITATQNNETVLNHTVTNHEGQFGHLTQPLLSSEPVDITITFQGFGEDEKTGPIGEKVVFSNVVPEFGTIAMMVLAVAIISIVAVTAKSRVVPRF